MEGQFRPTQPDRLGCRCQGDVNGIYASEMITTPLTTAVVDATFVMMSALENFSASARFAKGANISVVMRTKTGLVPSSALTDETGPLARARNRNAFPINGAIPSVMSRGIAVLRLDRKTPISLTTETRKNGSPRVKNRPNPRIDMLCHRLRSSVAILSENWAIPMSAAENIMAR